MTTNSQTGGQVMSDIQETIEKLRELDRAASPAPWWVGGVAWSHHAIMCERGESPEVVIDACFEGERLAANDPSLQLIVQARNALPVLLAEIDRLHQVEKALKERFKLIFNNNKWRSRRRDLIRRVQAEAWAEGYLDKETEASGAMIDCGLRERAKNPYQENKE